MSRPSEKFRFEPSRKFLLTAERLKDGTNRDEPRGTRRPALAEKAQDGVITQREAAQKLGVTDRWVRKLLTRMKRQGDAVVVHGLLGRPSNQAERGNEEAGSGAAETSRLARLWTDIRGRAVG